MKLVISIDVEEEGLFAGEYPRIPPGVSNVLELSRLEFIPREFGFPLTLLATYPVVRDPAAQEVLGRWREDFGAEIGVHLHPWNTPPFPDGPGLEPVWSRNLPLLLLRDKCATMVGCLEEFLGVRPRSFRMGRFEADARLLSVLPELGLGVDSSLVPLRQEIGGPDHFLVPPDPFWVPGVGTPERPLLEAPLTMVPVWRPAPQLVYRLSRSLPASWGERLRAAFSPVGALGIHPAWFPLAAMRGAVRLHRRRGGRVLNMFLHSSELKPGASPQFPTEAAVRRLVQKMRAFFTWLVQTGPIEGVTLGQLYGAVSSQ